MGIDLNRMEEEEEEEQGLSSYTRAQTVCLELWHACAGPLVSLPKRGSVVVYLPQGHLEHLGEAGEGISCVDVPSHVFCRVVDVTLHVDGATDEVFAQLSLVAENEHGAESQLQKGEDEGDAQWEAEDAERLSRATIPHMFCKTLTASDTSSHGGFSVPRRAAEDCFPPLDYKQQRPSQELVAKDLHGLEWRFRHIYRGQPRRHLLTTGWSAFINRKKLVSGDAVLFLRGNNGELRLGIRRAAQIRTSSSVSALIRKPYDTSTMTAIARAVSMKTEFNICYNPRAGSSEFIVPYSKFSKSMNMTLFSGMRFKMRFESEDATERRFTGLVTGTSDMDSLRWPGSKWKCLTVKWNDDLEISRESRISPWEIEPTGLIVGSSPQSATSSKRAKLCHAVNLDCLVPNGSRGSDLGESTRFHEVLQGQEYMGFTSPFDSVGEPVCDNYIIGTPHDRFGVPFPKSNLSFNCTGFNESVGFEKVLQGQEIIHKNSPFLEALSDARTRNVAISAVDSANTSNLGTRLATPGSYSALVHSFLPSYQAVSGSSVHPSPCLGSMYKVANILSGKEILPSSSLNPFLGSEFTLRTGESKAGDNSESKTKNDSNQNGCRLFGFPLTEGIPVTKVIEKALFAVPPSKETQFDIALTSKSQVTNKAVVHGYTGANALYTLCAAPIL